LVITIIKLIYH